MGLHKISPRAHRIRLSDEAAEHLRALTARQRATALDAVERQLTHQPAIETRHRKRMEPGKAGFIAPWELRVGDLRVYYDVKESAQPQVVVSAIGVKVRNRVRIGGMDYGP